MKVKLLLFLFATTLICCNSQEAKEGESISPEWQLEGFWTLVKSDFNWEEAIQQYNCPDPEALMQYEPLGMGYDLLFEEGKVSVFRYPYAYYGTYDYSRKGDSMVIERDGTMAYHVQEDSLFRIEYVDPINSTCTLISNASYKRFELDSNVIEKLLRDSVNFQSVVGKWWHLRKDISHEDGSDNFVLPFPEGMPDSVNIVALVDQQHPVITLQLKDRQVDMMLSELYKYRLVMHPVNEEDRLLFSEIYHYSESDADTVYFEVVFYDY